MFFCLLSFPFSCQRPADLPTPEPSVDTSISIEEAKSWFEQNYGTSSSPNSRVTKTEKKTPLWNFAKEEKFKKGHPIVVVPLAYEKGTNLAAVFDETGQKDTPEDWQRWHTLIRKLVIFKNKKGENRAVIMYVVPSQKYKAENPKDVKGNSFAGMVLFKDYNDEDVLLEGWRIENGEVMDVFGSQSSGKSKKNGRVMDCYFITYGHWEQQNSQRTLRTSQTTYSYNPWVWVVDYTSYHCSGSGNGYFEGQLPSGGGGSGFNPESYYSANNPQSQFDFMNEFHGILQEREIQHAIEDPIMMERIKLFKDLYGASTLSNVGSVGSILCGLLKRCINSDEESILSESGFYLLNLVTYAINAKLATDLTKQKFNNDFVNGKQASDCGVCSGNAYKHALFRLLDAHSFGADRAKRLGEAHERDSAHNDDRQMDLNNNQKGIDIYLKAHLWWLKHTVMNYGILSMYLAELNSYLIDGKLDYIRYKSGTSGDTEVVGTNKPGNSPY